MEGGASGFFSPPQEGLDPNLFDGTTLKQEVRQFCIGELWAALKKLGLKRPASWTYVWLAGSGVSYQWAGDRGNGDLDCLFGVNFPTFLMENRDWSGMSEEQFATWLNTHLKSDLWPKTASVQFGSQNYEVTFYLNAGTGSDIRNINPYAAYDLRKNSWTVTPQAVTDPNAYPEAWFRAANNDEATTSHLVGRHNELRDKIAQMVPGSPVWHNAGTELRQNAEAARALWEEIHGGRHEAFSQMGHGYEDWHNFRWQMAKRQGVVHALRGILSFSAAANDARDTELYGGPIASADESLSRAALVSRERPGLRR
jgi:hypothetical protein